MFKTSEYGNQVLNVEHFEVIRIGAYFHFVNHQAGLCSVGFGSLQNLLKYSDCIRADQPALRKMVDRYMEFFNK